jgi:flavin-dependent dehydrogenase
LICVGDAAAFIDPFTGSGIALALESSQLAFDALNSAVEFEKIARRYETSHRSAFDRRLRFCRMLRLASTSPRLAEATIAVLSRSSYLSGLFARATRAGALRASDTI